MECPKCKNIYDIYNAIISEEGEDEGLWICSDCKVILTDDDAVKETWEDEK